MDNNADKTVKKHFVTFASSNWKNSLLRQQNDIEFIQQNYNFFDGSTSIYTEKNIGEEYTSKFSQHFKDQGFAYWSWKPFVILKTLAKANDGDIIFYMDGGCSFPIDNIVKWMQDFQIFEVGLKHYDIGLTYSNGTTEAICKKKILQYFKLEEDQYLRKYFQHCQAGIQLMYKTPKIVNLVSEWYSFFENYYDSHIKSGFYSKEGEDECFYHNGADQAILHCLLYRSCFNIMNIGKLIQHYKMVTRIRN